VTAGFETEPKSLNTGVNSPDFAEESSAPLLTRNFDFPPGRCMSSGARAPSRRRAVLSRLGPVGDAAELGHATITVTAFDLLTGPRRHQRCRSGRSAVVCPRIDHRPAGGEPTFAPAADLHEVEMCRHVLERCADVDEAPDALRLAKHYYFLHLQHFLIAGALAHVVTRAGGVSFVDLKEW
jgi:hypothetical protein